ncbi:MAG: asparagine synthase (glutamine-hydrolyzing) [Phycisphaerales bacterium]
MDPAASLRSMAEAMRLRGPDDEGTWLDREHGVGFAFRRLAVQDLTQEGHQPMRSRSGRYTIVFNGEVYNFHEIRAELVSRAHAFRGGSDTEVMLAAFEEWGVARAVERFVGMFAFAVWDAHERRLHLVRDRLGVKPLYWGHVGPNARTLVFCSELKSIRALPIACPPIDRDAVALFMRFGYVPSPYSIFKGVHKLMPGHRVEIDAVSGRHETHRYWSAKEAAERGAREQIEDYGQAVELVEQALERSVKLRMISDVPLGSFLSGGVDSTLVTALAAKLSPGRLRTYTIGFKEAEYDEAPFARRIAQHLGTDHHELYVGARDSIDLIPTLADIFDEPFADSSAIPTYLLCKLARRDITVALCGDGGDELFGGYDRYLFAGRIESMLRRYPYPLRVGASGAVHAAMLLPSPLLQRLDRFVPGSRTSRTRDRLRKTARLLLERDPSNVYPRLASVVKDPEHYVQHYGAPSCPMSDPAWCPDVACAITRGAVRDLVSYMPDEILAKTDRVSMAVSLEAREPLTDHRLVELALRIPARFKFANGRNKVILRDLLDRHVPRELVDRPKMGFSVPIDHWLRGELREWGEDLLDEQRLEHEGLLDAHAVRILWDDHQSGDSQRQWELWNCLMLQTWMQRWGPSASTAHSAPEPRAIEISTTASPAEDQAVPAQVATDHEDPSSSASERRQFSGGTYWGLVQAFVQKGSAFLTYLVAAWTLQPEDVGGVTTAITIATLLSFIFPGAAADVLMHRQSATHVWQSACLWLAIAAGMLLVGLCMAATPLIEWRYHNPALALFTIAAAMRISLDAASMVGVAKLKLGMRFRYLAALDTTLSFLTLALTTVFGLLGFASWALLLPMVVVALLRFTMILGAARVPLFRPGTLARARVLVSDFRTSGIQHYLNGATQTLDYFAISLVATEDILGRYTIAYQLTFTVHVILAYTVAGIAQPIFSRLQHDRERQYETYLATQRLTMAVAAPLLIGLSIASPALVHMLLPERWRLASISVTVLALAFLMMNPIQIAAALMRARGEFRRLLHTQIIHTIALGAAVFATAGLGTARYVALAVLGVGACFGPLYVISSLSGSERGWKTVRSVYIAPLGAACICLLPQLLLLHALGSDSWTSLGAQVAAGVLGLALYVLALRTLDPTLHGQVRSLIAEVRQRAAKPLAA